MSSASLFRADLAVKGCQVANNGPQPQCPRTAAGKGARCASSDSFAQPKAQPPFQPNIVALSHFPNSLVGFNSGIYFAHWSAVGARGLFSTRLQSWFERLLLPGPHRLTKVVVVCLLSLFQLRPLFQPPQGPRPQLQGQPVCFNHSWQTDLGLSCRCGLHICVKCRRDHSYAACDK